MSTKNQQNESSADFEQSQRFTDWKRYGSRKSDSYRKFVQECGNDHDKPDRNNETKLYDLSDYPTHEYNRSRVKKLDSYNSGLQNLDWVNDPYVTYVLNSHLILALSSQLDLTKEQSQLVYRRFMQLDLEKWGHPAELVAFCVCAATVHRDDTEREYHYNQSQQKKDQIFIKIQQNLDLMPDLVRSVYSKYYRCLSDCGN